MYVMSSLSYMDGHENKQGVHQSICTFLVFLFIFLGGEG